MSARHFSNPETKTKRNICRNNLATGERQPNEFIAAISHDMRTPLNTIIGMLNVLSESGLSVEQAEQVRCCREAGKYMLGLVNEMVEAGAEANQASADVFDLLVLLNDTIKMIADGAIHKKLKLVIDVDHALPRYLVGDERKLRRILLNLLTNAIKFTDHGFVRLAIKSHFGKEEHSLNIIVEDSGPGINEKDHEGAFRPFTRLEDSAKGKDGFGLGLAIVKELVQQMDGTIDLRSKPQQGTTFSLQLPFKQVSQQECAAEISPATSSDTRTQFSFPFATKSGQNEFKLLVVDDSPDCFSVIKAYLKGLPITLRYFDDATAGVTAHKKERYDAILMDIELSQTLNGITATKLLREWENEANIEPVTIIAVSGHANPFLRKKFFQAGGDDWLMKPFTKQDLLTAIYKYSPLSSAEAALIDIKAASQSELNYLVPQFLDNRKVDLIELNQAYAIEDFALIARIGHRLKGDSRPYGFAFLERKGRELELAAKNFNTQKTKNVINEIEAYIKNARIAQSRMKQFAKPSAS